MATKKELVLNILNDGEWHLRNELLLQYYKFDTRISELKDEGYEIETMQNPYKKHERMYRWIKKPLEQESLF